MSAVSEFIRSLGFDTIDSKFYDQIGVWRSWAIGKIDSFHTYKIYNGEKMIEQQKKSLNIGKTACEDWANYIFNKDTTYQSDVESVDIALHEYFTEIKFHSNFSRSIECMFRDGTTAIVVYEDSDSKPVLNYIRDARMIFPVGWDSNGIINECIFASFIRRNGKKYLGLNFHLLDGEKYNIQNKFFLVNDGAIETKEVVFDDIESEYTADNRMFFVFTTGIMQIDDDDNPLGMSVLADAIDAMKGIDEVYDSYINEFVLGRKRLMVAMDAFKVRLKDGETVPTFDPRNPLYTYMPRGLDGEPIVKDINLTLRIAEHKEALQDMLNVFSLKIGMGSKHYSFAAGTGVTATEIRSTVDTLYNSILKHENSIQNEVQGLMALVGYMLIGAENKVTVTFDDSVIRDIPNELAQNLQLEQNGIISKAEVRAWWTEEDIEVAKNNIKQIASERGENSFSDFFEK